MSERKVVPLAYVTKWAATRGIVVVKGAEVTVTGALVRGHLFAPANQWTEDKFVAEVLWREAVERSQKAAQKKAKSLGSILNGPAKYEEWSSP